MKPVAVRRVTPSRADDPCERQDVVAIEEPLAVRLEGRTVTVTMRTPGHDRELAAGFLLGEGIVDDRADIFDIVQCPSAAEENVVDVTLVDPTRADPARFSRHVLTSSACGLCGTTTVARLRRRHPLGTDDWRVAPEILFGLPPLLAGVQVEFAKTGGLHAAAVVDASGRLVIMREDVGRHNAVDKVIGAALLDGRLPLSRFLLLVSSRASFEILQKAGAAGIPLVAAIGAPTSLAVETAEAQGQTLVGFLRSDRLNLYTHPGRVSS